VLLYGGLHYINEIKDLIKSYQSLGKVFPKTSLDIEIDISNRKTEDKTKIYDTGFVKPTVEDVRAYCRERRNTIDPEAFIAHYEARGWRLPGNLKMKSWKSAVITWEKNSIGKPAISAEEARKNAKREAEVERQIEQARARQNREVPAIPIPGFEGKELKSV
jgi:hypothetical protein